MNMSLKKSGHMGIITVQLSINFLKTKTILSGQHYQEQQSTAKNESINTMFHRHKLKIAHWYNG